MLWRWAIECEGKMADGVDIDLYADDLEPDFSQPNVSLMMMFLF